MPEGALAIAAGPARKLRSIVQVLARESYPSKRGGKDTYLLVPGIPEAVDQNEALRCLFLFIDEVKDRLKSTRETWKRLKPNVILKVGDRVRLDGFDSGSRLDSGSGAVGMTVLESGYFAAYRRKKI
jgi:hypothetical protein